MKTQELIGTIHKNSEERDAIHIAVAQVGAGEEMNAGENIGFKDNESIVYKSGVNYIGIVDPYLKDTVRKGSLFYMFLYPNTISSLNHSWTHPAFDREHSVPKAEEWLKVFLKDKYDEYDQYETTLANYKAGHGVTYFGWTDIPDRLNKSKELRKKLWDCLEIVSGIPATKEQREQDYFSCSC